MSALGSALITRMRYEPNENDLFCFDLFRSAVVCMFELALLLMYVCSLISITVCTITSMPRLWLGPSRTNRTLSTTWRGHSSIDAWHRIQTTTIYKVYFSHFVASLFSTVSVSLLLISPKMTCKTSQIYVYPCGVNIFKTLRLWDFWVKIDGTWYIYSMGRGTKLPGSGSLAAVPCRRGDPARPGWFSFYLVAVVAVLALAATCCNIQLVTDWCNSLHCCLCERA